MTCTALEYRKSTDDDDDQEDDGENEFQFVRSCTAKAKELENLSIQTQYDCATSLCDPLKPDDEIGVKGWSFIIFIILAISIALCFFIFYCKRLLCFSNRNCNKNHRKNEQQQQEIAMLETNK